VKTVPQISTTLTDVIQGAVVSDKAAKANGLVTPTPFSRY
jgi:hypothetical protein